MPLNVHLPRRLPIGAEVLTNGGVHFRVWAPRRQSVSVVIEGGEVSWDVEMPLQLPLIPEEDGYFSATILEAKEGTLYRFLLDGEDNLFPDPASRFQPYGPKGPSQVIDSAGFEWTDHTWRGVGLKGQVIYEMHIGTFTHGGNFKSAIQHLPELADIGITLLEIMPVAEFFGEFGWGYDGVDLFAPSRLYGHPDDFRRFIDQAHSLGIGVVLDVVYNHLGPVGNFLKEFSLDYFSDRYETEWGEAFNLDGKNSGSVREFIISNACYWISEFHLDGFRLDATQQIFDSSCEHILSDLTKKAREAAAKRSIVVIAENEPQQVKLVRPPSRGGYGMDGIWNDDFHHTAMVALTGRNEAYYSDYNGTPQELISAVKWGFLYQGQYYTWQNKKRGTSAFGLKPECFINFIQNHDQIANSPRGERCTTITTPGRYRAIMGLLLLTPPTPLLFQGQEFCASSTFCYFADHKGELGKMVREGRTEFLQQFPSFRSPDIERCFPDPTDLKTFELSKVDHSERSTHKHMYALHRDLLKLRREDPVFRAQRTDWMYGAVIGPEAFVLRFLCEDDGDRLIIVNLGRDLHLSPVPEPLLSSPEDSHWELLWSSESAEYGGNGTPTLYTEGKWSVPGHSTIAMAPKKVVRAYRG